MGFLDQMNKVHQNIQFTVEDGVLPFLDTDIFRRPNSTLGHKVCHKPTSINL
jgi:hypothetical protein